MKSKSLLPAGLVAATVTAAMLGGCAGIGWLASVLAPPQKIKPVYEPPKDKTVLVLVDDPAGVVSYEPLKRELSDELSGCLTTHKVALQTIEYRRLLELSSTTPGYQQLTIKEIGEKLGADLVLYVHVDRFALKDVPENPIWRGELGVTVRWVDVAEGRTIWPQGRPEGEPVPPVFTPESEDPSSTYAAKLSSQLSQLMADRVSKLFYEHKVDVRELQAGKELKPLE